MEEIKTIDTRESIKVVTSNELITAHGLSDLSLKARKVLYLAMSQCKQNDEEFFTYEISSSELALQLGIGRNHVYETADSITRELMTKYLEVVPEGKKKFKRYSLFAMCEYDEDGVLRFKLNKDMTSFLLGVKKSFTQPLLSDFMKMRSVYSMAIWHLFQREMKSCKASIRKRLEFDLTLEELRIVTGTESKLKNIGMWKKRVLEQALKEIEGNQLAKIGYTNIKRGRYITGFHFEVESLMGTYNPPPEFKKFMDKKVRKVELTRKSNEGKLTSKEFDELQSLILELDQMSISDFLDVEGNE